ncbi:MAG: hypothetical protein JST48_03010 [Bacteroidetes bacterium]|nr:hypothetical protein [Bacteroidota bacterium]
MIKNVNEELLAKSFDANLSHVELDELQHTKNDIQAKKLLAQHGKLRQLLLRKEQDSFGPFFAERVVNQIKRLSKEIDYQIYFFFKKYQLAAVGLVIALIVLNIFLSDTITVKSVLGFENQPAGSDSDLIENLDLFNELTN